MVLGRKSNRDKPFENPHYKIFDSVQIVWGIGNDETDEYWKKILDTDFVNKIKKVWTQNILRLSHNYVVLWTKSTLFLKGEQLVQIR